MNIIEWNIQHGGGKRIHQILERIESHDPEIAVLTEYRNSKPGRLIRQHLEQIGFSFQVAGIVINISEFAEQIIDSYRRFEYRKAIH